MYYSEYLFINFIFLYFDSNWDCLLEAIYLYNIQALINQFVTKKSKQKIEIIKF